MKHIMKSVLAFLLLVVMLASCNSGGNTTTPTTEPTTPPVAPTEEDRYPEPLKQLLAENKPYSLEFTSNGDGTCYVSHLYLNNRYETAFDVTIPEKSPAGDTVTGIDLGDSLTFPGEMLPKYMTKKRLDEIKAKVEADYPDVDAGYAGLWWINAYKVLDVSQMTPEERAEVIEQCPLAEYMVVAEFLPKMSNTEDTFRRVKMMDLTPSVTKQYYEELMQEAREAGAPEEILTPYKELIEALPIYANYSDLIQYVHIPSSVNSINVESLRNLMFEFVVDGNRMVRGIVLPVLDFETTETLSSATMIGLPHNARFYIFSQSTSSVRFEEINNFAIYSPEEPPKGTLAWHYVDGVPTLWHVRFYP